MEPIRIEQAGEPYKYKEVYPCDTCTSYRPFDHSNMLKPWEPCKRGLLASSGTMCHSDYKPPKKGTKKPQKTKGYNKPGSEPKLYKCGSRSHTVKEWSEITGISINKLYYRLERMTIEEALGV